MDKKNSAPKWFCGTAEEWELGAFGAVAEAGSSKALASAFGVAGALCGAAMAVASGVSEAAFPEAMVAAGAFMGGFSAAVAGDALWHAKASGWLGERKAKQGMLRVARAAGGQKGAQRLESFRIFLQSALMGIEREKDFEHIRRMLAGAEKALSECKDGAGWAAKAGKAKLAR